MMRSNLISKQPDEEGNVVFLLFLAVGLFAALGFTVTDMMRGGAAEQITDEKTRLHAAELLEVARQIKQSVQQAKLGFGCSDNTISFENPYVSGYEHTPQVDSGCIIFGENGGANYKLVPGDWLDPAQESRTRYREWYFTGGSCVIDIGTGSADCATANGTNDSDLILVAPWLKQGVCVELNAQLGIENPGGRPPVASSSNAWPLAMTQFKGTYSADGIIDSSGSNVAILTGAPAGCFEGNTVPPTETYHFYQVLIAR